MRILHTTTRYASGTKVEGEQSRKELERLLHRYAADGFGYAWDTRVETTQPKCEAWRCEDQPIEECLRKHAHAVRKPRAFTRTLVAITFRFKERRIRLEVPMPAEHEYSTKKQVEQATRQRWRALILVVKAKLEAVASGISTLEAEFLANVVMPDGRTIGESIVPRLTYVEQHGLLLPEHTNGAIA